MREEGKFATHLRDLIQDLDPPPATPREAIWARIEEARAGRRPARRATVTLPWLRWGAPLAAMLAIGIAIGRFVLPAGTAGPASADPAIAMADAPRDFELAYEVAAVEHLGATEALLAALPHDVRRGDIDQMSSWAEELLVTTRLMLDSPAAADPDLASLFQDLELVLVQIASLSAGVAEQEFELIQEGIRQNDVLLRVRAATTQRAAAGI